VSPRSRDPAKAAAQQANLIKGQSDDPAIAARQKRGLQPGRTTHGAYSRALREPVERQHRERLALEFPGAITAAGGQDLLNSTAKRAAMLDLMSAWLADNGPVTGRGDVAAPARELRHLLDAHERAIVQLQGLERAHGSARVPLLHEYIEQKQAAELAAAAGEPESEGGER
jgi:hypothetical protein